MQKLSSLFPEYQVPQPQKKSRVTERGELLKYFSTRLNMPIKRVAFHVGHLKECKDLYYLKSDCEKAEHRGVPFSAAFWHAIKVPVGQDLHHF